MSNLFISHSSRDNDAARELQTRLASQGHRSVFLDFDPETGIQTGASWERTLYTKLRACHAVVALCSDSYLSSQWCFAEVALARMEGKALFVLQIEPWSADTKMPSILTEAQCVDLRQDPEVGYQRLWNGFKAQGIVAAEARDWRPEQPPYPGLRAFHEEDAPIFFGRDPEIREGCELLNRVRRQGHPRLVMVLGSSGSGKSSLVRAGIVPQLRRDRAQWQLIKPFRPGPQPMRALATALTSALVEAGQPCEWEDIHRVLDPAVPAEPGAPATDPAVSASDVEPSQGAARARLLQALSAMESALSAADETVASSVRRLKDYLARPEAEPALAKGESLLLSEVSALAGTASRLLRHSAQVDATVVLVIDQFEELLGHDVEHPASRFLATLRVALEVPDSPLLVLGTMRSDYLGGLQRCAPLLGLGFKSLSVGPMSRRGMRQIIEEPARLGQVRLEDGLSDTLLEDTQTSDALPLLAFVLRMMWDRFHASRLFAVRDYEALGGLQGAIAQVADDTLDVALTLGEENDLRDAFLSLARPASEGAGWARQAAQWQQMSERVRPMLQKFVDQRLLVKRADGSVEVAHEAIFRSWGKLRGWLDENAEGLHLLRDLRLDAEKWRQAAADDDGAAYLWRAGRLARAIELRDGGVLFTRDLERAFIDASHSAERALADAEEARRQQELRRARVVAGVVGGLLLGALGALGVAIYQWNLTQAQERISNSGRLASLAINELDQSLGLALLLSVQAGQTAQTAAAVDSLAQALAHSPRLVALLHGHENRVRAVAFSPAVPTLLASAGDDKTVRFWDMRTLAPLGAPLLHEAGLNKITFSPAGDLLATASDEKAIRLWNMATHAQVGELSEPRGSYRVAFSPDGKLIASASEGTLGLWDTTTRTPRYTPARAAHDGQTLLNVAFSPDGQRLVTSSRDRTVVLWDVASGQARQILRGHGEDRLRSGGSFGYIEGLAFDPNDARVLVSAGRDHTIRFWDLGAHPPGPSKLLLRDDQPVMDVAFSPDGKRLASANYAGTLRLWDVATRQPLDQPLTGHAAPVRGIAFRQDGRRLVSASDDRTVGVWNLENLGQPPSFWQPSVLTGHVGGVASVVFSPDGHRLASAGYDHTVRLWDTTRREPLGQPLMQHTDSVVALAFSPDGDRLASASNDMTVRLWDVATASPIGGPLMHGAAVEGVAFSADGQRLATVSRDRKLQLWDVGSGRRSGPALEIQETQDASLVGSVKSLTSVAFSPDGDYLVAGLNVAGIGDFNFESPALRADTNRPYGALRLWDVSADPPVAIEDALPGNAESVFGLAFSRATGPLLLATASRDKTVVLWDVARRQPFVQPLRGHQQAVMAVAFSPDGRRVASASYDRTLRLWDVATGQAIGPPMTGHGDVVEGLAFSPDGRQLASASFDGTIRIWNVDEATWPRRACAIANRNFTAIEWTQYMGKDSPYCRTCPDLPAPERAPANAPACGVVK